MTYDTRDYAQGTSITAVRMHGRTVSGFVTELNGVTHFEIPSCSS